MSKPLRDIKNTGVFTSSTVVSGDGTKIGYQSIGHGPGLIIVHGALSTHEDFTRLAEELSDSFRVHVMDRRGRGMSGPQGSEYSIEKEYDDLRAVQEATGAKYIFGHSFGGLVTMEYAMRNDTLKKLAIYEPGISINRSISVEWISEYEEDMKKKDYMGAFAAFTRPHVKALQRMPKWLVKFMLSRMIKGEKWDRMKSLLPQNLKEHKEVGRLDSTYEKYKAVKADVLIISGSKSPEWTKGPMELLARTLLHGTTLTIPGMDHLSPENDASPEKVAAHVKQYFLN